MSLQSIIVQYSSVRGQKKNTSYPFRAEINSIEDMRKIAAFDHVCGVYADGTNTRGRVVQGYRSKKTFQKANCLPMDCDNSVSDPVAPDIPESKWKTPADVQKAFPGVPFYVVYSRHHMKVKDGKAARPKWHVYFVTSEITSEQQLDKLKKRVREHFPAFDDNALDTARFMYGVENPQVEYYDGDTPLNVFMDKLDTLPDVIPVGARNGTLSRYAAKILKKYGDNEQAFTLFGEAAGRCEQPLDESELQTIWNSAQGFFHNTVEKDPGYIPADEYAAMDFEDGGEKKIVTSEVVKQILAKMGITVRLNVISGMVEIAGMPEKYSAENAANTLPVLLMDYIKTHNMKCTRQNLDDCLVLIEDENRFNPVADMLNRVRYDGQDRIKVLKQILSIEGNERECMYLTKWLHQCISLALNNEKEPYGADGVFVIQGEQGAGKTLFFKTLAVYADWFAEGVSIDLDKKDSVIQSTGVVIAELGELDSTLKREQSALKAFLTASRDVYRQPYARTATRKPRRTSFCATVNPQEFLNDETGSRRFWVVHSPVIDVERLLTLSREWVMQLWAQVYETLYKADAQGFRLTREERAALQAENEQYSKPLPGEIEITDNLNFDAPDKLWKWVKVSQLLRDLCIHGVTPAQAGKVLAKLSKQDERIVMKNSHNVKQYYLPPKACNEFMHYDDDDIPPLSGRVSPTGAA
jgi:hypothetical protein